MLKKYIELLRARGMRLRSVIYAVLLITVILVVGKCRQDAQKRNFRAAGETMGTFYEVFYVDKEQRDLLASIDSVFQVFNQSLSTYIAGSELSRYNRDSILEYESAFVYPVLRKSKEIYTLTGGAFDPTVKPLVNAWGFGSAPQEKADSSTIDSLRAFTGFDKVLFDAARVWKKDSRVQLDFGAIAKGYGVDVLGEYLESLGIEHYFINVGGEIRARGQKPDEKPWMVGIEDPATAGTENFGKVRKPVPLFNRSVATSGDYRNYREREGKRYGHTIDPRTGYPKQSDMISASVMAEDCMTADAYATAMMVLGAEASIQLADRLEDIDVFLIYIGLDGQEATYMTPGFDPR